MPRCELAAMRSANTGDKLENSTLRQLHGFFLVVAQISTLLSHPKPALTRSFRGGPPRAATQKEPIAGAPVCCRGPGGVKSCQRGHPQTQKNVRVHKDGRRRCRLCR